MDRIKRTLGPLAALVLIVPTLAACHVGATDTELDDPPVDGPDAGATEALCLPSNVASTVFARKCTGGACHDAELPAAGLDLQSAGVADRMIGVTSSSACAGEVLVVAGDPNTSYLVDKLSGTAGCGDQMPKGGTPLSAEEMDCVTGWIAIMNPESGGSGGGTGPGGGY